MFYFDTAPKDYNMDNRWQLPGEINHLIYSLLPLQDILNHTLTCTNTYKMLSTPRLWKQLVERDFAISIKEEDCSKKSYAELKVNISRERERFVSYMTAFQLINFEIEKHDLNEEMIGLDQFIKDMKKRDFMTNLLNDLDAAAIKSDEVFNEYYNNLTQLTNKDELITYRKQFNDLHIMYISYSNEDIFKITQDTISDQQSIDNIFHYAFLALCKLNASLSIGLILRKNANQIMNFENLLIQIFEYPCLKAIKRLLDYPFNLNNKYWTHDEIHRMHITPLVAAVLCMLNKKQVTVSKEIIAYLLEKGADTQIPVFLSDDDWHSEEEYNKRCRTIHELCHWLIANRAEKFENVEDRNIFIESMQMIINHAVSKTAKPVIAVKYVTAQPSFWQSKGCGNRKTPLTKNTCSAIFLTSEDIKKAEQRPDINQIKTVSTRERWLNKILENHVKVQNYKQIIILGSGFDIRPYKKNRDNQKNKPHANIYSQVRFWEIDQKNILDAKEQIYKSNGFDKNATYIRADYTKDNFVEQLVSSDLKLDMPTLIIWEGNLMYLEKSQIIDVVNSLKSSLKDFTIAFDYFTQSFINSIESLSPLKVLWKTGIDNIKEFAKETGLTIADVRNIRDLEIEYDVDNNPCERAEQYSLCALRK